MGAIEDGTFSVAVCLKACVCTLCVCLSCMKDKKVLGNSQHGFLKDESCLTKLMAFYKEITVSVDKGRTVNVFALTLVRLSTLPSITLFQTNGKSIDKINGQ